jgi:RPA family protein
MKQWAYQISDPTGKIWVVTNQGNLQKGTQVVLKGKIRYQSIPIAGQDFGEVYLEE